MIYLQLISNLLFVADNHNVVLLEIAADCAHSDVQNFWRQQRSFAICMDVGAEDIMKHVSYFIDILQTNVHSSADL